MKSKLIIPLLFIFSLSFSQDKPSPPTGDLKITGEEDQRLAKFKERILKNRAELDSLQTKQYAISRDIILKQQEINNSVNILNQTAENIKKEHEKEWGDSKNIDYQPDSRNPMYEGGVFTVINKTEINKEEIKNGSTESKKADESKKDEKGKVLKQNNKVNKPKK